MKTHWTLKNILAFILLINVLSACEHTNSNKRSCIYCGKAISDNKEIAIKLNESPSIRGGERVSNKSDVTTKGIAEKKSSLKVSRLDCELCSMKCYSDFKNTFYQQNRDSIFGGKQSINVWILNEKENQFKIINHER